MEAGLQFASRVVRKEEPDLFEQPLRPLQSSINAPVHVNAMMAASTGQPHMRAIPTKDNMVLTGNAGWC